ncbi:hypothetical protein EDD15DRAFT_2518804 [Pisolithus albus]|nr:hypothetical protein EDD15DRAFT_2518804 [Pisolithus albus]
MVPHGVMYRESSDLGDWCSLIIMDYIKGQPFAQVWPMFSQYVLPTSPTHRIHAFEVATCRLRHCLEGHYDGDEHDYHCHQQAYCQMTIIHGVASRAFSIYPSTVVHQQGFLSSSGTKHTRSFSSPSSSPMTMTSNIPLSVIIPQSYFASMEGIILMAPPRPTALFCCDEDLPCLDTVGIKDHAIEPFENLVALANHHERLKGARKIIWRDRGEPAVELEDLWECLEHAGRGGMYSGECPRTCGTLLSATPSLAKTRSVYYDAGFFRSALQVHAKRSCDPSPLNPANLHPFPSKTLRTKANPSHPTQSYPHHHKDR